MDLIPNDWKALLRTEISQKFLLKVFYYKNIDFQELSDKEICFILLFSSSKYNKLFKFISWPNLLEGYHIFSLEISGKTFTCWFKK